MSEKPIVKVFKKTIDGVDYLIDKANNAYNPQTKQLIGTYDKETETFIPFRQDENDIQFEGSEFETKQGIWTFIFVVSDKETEEKPIEEDDEGNITEWAYSFPIFWNGVIESETERTNITELIPNFPKDYRVGTFTLYTKNILNDDEKISKIDRKWGRSDSDTSWTLDIEGNIQRLINEGELEGKKESEKKIADRIRREEALKRMEETRLARKAEREEKEKINNPDYIESSILELQEEIKTETSPDKLKILNKLVKGLEKKLAIAKKEKLDREEYQLRTFGSKEEQEQKRQKEKEDLEALKKQLKSEKAKATREKNKKEKEEKEARLLANKKAKDERTIAELKTIGKNAIKQLEEKEREEVKARYSSVIEKLPMIEKYASKYSNYTFRVLLTLTGSLVRALDKGILIGDIDFINELISIIETLPEKNKSDVMDTTGNIPFYPSIVPPEIINKVENDYIRLEPKVKEIGKLADETIIRDNDKLSRLITSISVQAFDYSRYLPDLVRFKKDTEKEEAKKQKKKEAKKKEGKGIDNPALYEKAKLIADATYSKPSAYKSGFIVKKYKEMGGTYTDDGNPKNLKRWFKEDWKDIGNKEYPVYRPTKRISLETPLTPEEIKPSNLKKQIALKQEIKGNANLPAFQGKGVVVSLGQSANNISENDEVYKFSNPKKVQQLAKKYLGKDGIIYRSIKKDKKYMVYDPNTKKWVHFGQMGYEDFTKHKDEKRRKNYLTRTAGIKGDWKDDKYSANNLSRNLLW